MITDSFGFTLCVAKRLTFRKSNRCYAMIEDRDGQEWLVGAVLDNGRQMELIKPDTNGKETKRIESEDYKNYKIILAGNDIAPQPKTETERR